jgi:hypothetical protein
MDNNDKSNFDEHGCRQFGYPTNAKEWWQFVDDRWPFLLDIVFHHMDSRALAYEIPGNDKSKPTGRNIAAELEYLKLKRDRRLSNYLSASWAMASDAYAWSVPFWGVLCDLCSESPHCLYEDCDGPPDEVIEDCKTEPKIPSSSSLDW